MKYDLRNIYERLEKNVVPKSMAGLDLKKHYENLMKNMKYEVVLDEPQIKRPAFVTQLMQNKKGA